MQRRKKYYLLAILFLFGLFIALYRNRPIKVRKNINELYLKNINKLMIVAHPDDEVLWGGFKLLEDDYLVVCVTCGDRKVRVKEFKKAMKISGDSYLMLGYPDKRNDIRDNWLDYYDDISFDISEIISYKDWDLIVTHNPDGEYGHIHHRTISNIVTNKYHKRNNLFYFGKYYTKKKVKNEKKPQLEIHDKKIINKKHRMINTYKSQKFIQTKFDHMFYYEDWINSSDWHKLISKK